MLSARGIAIVLAMGSLLLPRNAGAQGDEPEDVLHRPVRLTVANADDLLGQLSPDGQTLYFVSHRNQRSEIFAQNVAEGRAKVLFDDNADVTWPRVSPDGKRLLYVSFGAGVHGQLCIRSLPDGEDRRCFGGASTTTQAEWIDRSRIVAVSRTSLHGDLRVLEVDAAKLESRPLFDRNLTGAAISPDGEWLAYVPIERDVATVGPAFASHAGRRLEAVRLTSPGIPATKLEIDLPGLTAQPAFARDGRSIVIAQFIDDTNQDGAIDANDAGVLFRVPFAIRDGAPVAGSPEQLTDTSLNCEYPAPAADRLVATCARARGGLEIYTLPLEGEAPADWTPARLATESEAAASSSERQLLASLRVTRETTAEARRIALFSLVRLHLELEQFDAAAFYAARASNPQVRMLVEHRRDMRDRERGMLVGSFSERARRRLESLRLPENARDLAFDHVLRSEIADSIGDKAEARKQLEAVSLDANASLPIIEAYFERADALYRELDDREALVRVCRALSESTALTPNERLRFARAAVRAMVRGVSLDEATARIARERAAVLESSELAFALDLSRAVLRLHDDEILALYEKEPRADRRRALVEETVARADQVGAHAIIEALAQRWLADSPKGTAERRLYRRAITARAFRNASRADFDAVAQATDSYEAEVGSIDLRLQAGESRASIAASYSAPQPRARFARAYLIAKQLPVLEGESATQAASEALSLLRASWAELAGKRMVHATQGALLHDRYLRTNELAWAERANVQYEIALELMGRGSNLRVMLLGQLGLLHTQVGNYRIAAGYLDERDKLQRTDEARDLAIHLAHARALLHVARESDAATVADRAVALVEKQPGPERLLALDRAALCNLAAGRFTRSLALYDVLLPQLDTPRNRFVARLGRAASAIGAEKPERGLADLDEVDRALKDPSLVAQARPTQDHMVATYRLIAMGLRARAYRAQGRLEDEARALEARHTALEARFAFSQRDDDERSAMLAEMQLALNARERHDSTMAASWAARALAHADDLHTRVHGRFDNGQLDALWLVTQLTIETKTPVVHDLAERLDAASSAITASHDPALRTYQRWFEAYRPIVDQTARR